MTLKTSVPAVTTFLAGLPPERLRQVERVRDVVRRHLPPGYEEVVSKNMLVYQVPIERYPDTYNGQPLWYVALASEKSYLSLHLMRVYADAEQSQQLEDGFRAAGKKLDRGKACIHFKTADDLALDVVGDLVASTPIEQWIQIARSARAPRARSKRTALTAPSDEARHSGAERTHRRRP